jgi:hypothetical protein
VGDASIPTPLLTAPAPTRLAASEDAADGNSKKAIPESHVEVSTMAIQRYDGRLMLLGYRASVLFDLQSFTLFEVQAYAPDEGGADKHGD